MFYCYENIFYVVFAVLTIVRSHILNIKLKLKKILRQKFKTLSLTITLSLYFKVFSWYSAPSC